MALTRRTATLGLLAFTVVGVRPVPAHAVTLKWAHVYEPEEPFHQHALWAAREVRSRTGGGVEISVFPASQLGNENQINDSLSSGTIDIIYTGTGFAGTIYPPFGLAHAPYTIRDFDHWMAFRDSDLFRELSTAYEQLTGQRVITSTYYGQRHVTANRLIRTPADMRGMKLRVPPLALFLMFTRAMGAEAVPIAFADVYEALRQGAVDGQENPLPTIMAKRFYEVQSHIMLTAHVTDSLLTLVGDHVWPALTEQQKDIVTEVLREAAARASSEVQAKEATLVDEFVKLGINVVDVDRQAFVDAVLPFLDDATAGAGWSPAQFEALQAL